MSRQTPTIFGNQGKIKKFMAQWYYPILSDFRKINSSPYKKTFQALCESKICGTECKRGRMSFRCAAVVGAACFVWRHAFACCLSKAMCFQQAAREHERSLLPGIYSQHHSNSPLFSCCSSSTTYNNYYIEYWKILLLL